MLLMSQTADVDQTELFSMAYDALPLPIQTCLFNGLNVDGYNDEKAILLYYMPAIFSEALKNIAYEPLLQKIKAVSSLMCFLTRVLNGTIFMPGKKGKVMKHNVLFAHATIQSKEFKQDPTILDKLEIPADYC